MSSMNIKKNNSLSSAPPLKTLAPQKNISQLENFALSALAPSMAVIFTLPFDTVKVRMQLQGEVKFMKDSAGKTVRVSADKAHYRKLLCEDRIQAFDEHQELDIEIPNISFL
ncbi:8620_t:CDS:2 [Entrophospora sp. SA101]|nr:8620_t:CDS:2 [Entrophospora sp. SA101]